MKDDNENYELLKEQILKAYSTVNKQDINFTWQLYELIMACSETLQPKLFQYCCELWAAVDSSDEIDTPINITQEKKEQLKEIYGKLSDNILASLIKRSLVEVISESEFYTKLWKGIINTTLFETKEIQVFAMYNTMIDDRIPYFELDTTLKMSNDDFKQLLRDTLKVYRKVRYILSIQFTQKTEGPSLIIKELEKLGNFEKQTILLMRIIQDYKRREERLIDEISKR